MKKHRSRNKARFRTKDKDLFQNNIFNRDAHVIPDMICYDTWMKYGG